MNEAFFQREYTELARDLLGRKVQMGDLSFFILESEGFSKKKNGGLYEPVTFVSPGSVYCPKFHNHCLLLIACLSAGEIGGCVKVQAIELSNGEMVKKPGLVTQALGITEHGLTGQLFELNGELGLSLNGATPPKLKPLGKKGSVGISQKDVQTRMKKIIKVYMERRKTHADLTFQAFLAECFSCASLGALNTMLK